MDPHNRDWKPINPEEHRRESLRPQPVTIQPTSAEHAHAGTSNALLMQESFTEVYPVEQGPQTRPVLAFPAGAATSIQPELNLEQG